MSDEEMAARLAAIEAQVEQVEMRSSLVMRATTHAILGLIEVARAAALRDQPEIAEIAFDKAREAQALFQEANG